MKDQYVAPGDVTSDDKLWAALAYVFSPIVPVIILLMEDKKTRPFIKAHNMQALILGLVLWVINVVLSFVFVGICTSGLTLILMIYYGYTAYQGKYINVPVISDLVKKQGWE